jgi:hypothetical protein
MTHPPPSGRPPDHRPHEQPGLHIFLYLLLVAGASAVAVLLLWAAGLMIIEVAARTGG